MPPQKRTALCKRSCMLLAADWCWVIREDVMQLYKRQHLSPFLGLLFLCCLLLLLQHTQHTASGSPHTAGVQLCIGGWLLSLPRV